MAHDPHHHHHGAHDADSATLADLLDLDAEVLGSYLSSAIARVHDLAAHRPVRRIVDLGCGTGSAAVILAQRFPDAEVVAVDQSAEMLARLQAKAARLGLTDRVRVVEADLDEPWPAIGTADVVWSSMALHHLADPDRALKRIFAAIDPGGLLAVAEMISAIRFLPDDIGVGRPGLEERCIAALAEQRSASMPYLGADWGALVARAGFTDVAERIFDIELTPPLPASAGRYAQEALRRMRTQLDSALAADDLATLDLITGDDGPQSLRHRQDLTIRGVRTLWTATRPSAPS